MAEHTEVNGAAILYYKETIEGPNEYIVGKIKGSSSLLIITNRTRNFLSFKSVT